MKPHIPQPCYEDWNAMTAKEKGRHCDVCAKVVVDFTKMNDAEIIDYLQEHQNQRTCGHFRNEQLYQSEKLEINLATIPTNLPFRKYFAVALVIAFASFGLVSCKNHKAETVGIMVAMDSTQTIQTIDSNSVEGEIAPIKVDTANEILGNICVQPSDSVNVKTPIKKIKSTVKGELDGKPVQQENSFNQKTTGIVAN